MKISRIRWTQQSVDHIGRHNVQPREVEGVAFEDQPLTRKNPKRKGAYVMLGKTQDGRYLVVVFRVERRGEASIITAFDMDGKTSRTYKRTMEP